MALVDEGEPPGKPGIALNCITKPTRKDTFFHGYYPLPKKRCFVCMGKSRVSEQVRG